MVIGCEVIPKEHDLITRRKRKHHSKHHSAVQNLTPEQEKLKQSRHIESCKPRRLGDRSVLVIRLTGR